MGFLTIVDFLSAFLARKLPDGFNIAKFPILNMFLFCSVWFFFTQVYFIIVFGPELSKMHLLMKRRYWKLKCCHEPKEETETSQSYWEGFFISWGNFRLMVTEDKLFIPIHRFSQSPLYFLWISTQLDRTEKIIEILFPFRKAGWEHLVKAALLGRVAFLTSKNKIEDSYCFILPLQLPHHLSVVPLPCLSYFRVWNILVPSTV